MDINKAKKTSQLKNLLQSGQTEFILEAHNGLAAAPCTSRRSVWSRSATTGIGGGRRPDGRWMDINNLDDLQRAGDFAYQQDS
jgi:hypothetical protein